MPISGMKRSLSSEGGDGDGTHAANDANNNNEDIQESSQNEIVCSDNSDEDAPSTQDIATITNVLDTIGIEVYKYLHPSELFSFSLANHHVYNEVSKGLIQTCLRQLPPNFGSNSSEHSIIFKTRHSFPEKEKLLDHVMNKIRTAELKLVGAEDSSAEDALTKAREVLHACGVHARGVGGSAKFFSTNYEHPKHLQTEFTSVGYHYEKDNRKLSRNRSQYMISRMALEGDASHIVPIKTWIDYILSQKQIVAGTWFWSVRHRNLDFQGVEGKGVMISSPNVEGEEMEICWTKMTASRV
eukprot:CAMPEP_0183718478 /NCGR_PEP_ID=MMETSP0737-20130205/11717_1 /TAXON_ID=385413 /ORGANISM="Thalassiosira miniscula, Strain CCMP1093" /LENGTH=297 /DNA_ID=CAMNT_0025948039 /DNA_START=86 /DNA_END=979 /DNA_ORIENTATION=-